MESELEKANALKDRKRVKLLLNNLWWQIKDSLKEISFQNRIEISALFDHYGESKHFKKISEVIYYGGKPNPNRVVESIRTAKRARVDEEMKFVWDKGMVRRANGTVEEIE